MLMKEHIQKQLNILPQLSGSYQFYDKAGELIYIGKAKNLKKRVSSYFHKKHESPKLLVMVPQIERIEYIVTDSEIEALILESELIKKHKPKYNILLKDDKKFPYFVITDEEYPRIIVARKRNKNPIKGKYFGPYTDVRAMYVTLDLIKKLFPLKQCKTPKFKNRPCLYYQIGRCLAPCQKLVSSEEYKEILKGVELFLSGKQSELVEKIKEKMLYHSEQEEYELAARYRDSYFDIQKTMERQKVVSENTKLMQDIIGLARDGSLCAIVILKIRQGRLISSAHFEISISEDDINSDIISSFFKEYYSMCSLSEIPKEILICESLSDEDIELYKTWLSKKNDYKVKFAKLDVKKNAELISLANKNAMIELEKIKLSALTKIQAEYNEVGTYIQEKLGLKHFPHRIECFDISHIQGTNTVASMVVFENGMPKKSDYKKFRIKSLENGVPNDFESMREVVTRRYKNTDVNPDLVIIDGGKGQLSAVCGVLKDFDVNFDIVSLAKRIEEVFVPNKSESIIFPINSDALYLFQRVRDEAHRFAINYHRKLRETQATKSVLDDIKYLSERSKNKLLQEFKSVSEIKNKSFEELCEVINKKSAKSVYNFFNSLK